MFHLTVHKRSAASALVQYFERWCSDRDIDSSAYYMGAGDDRLRALWRTFGREALGVHGGDGVAADALSLMMRGVDSSGYFAVDPGGNQLDALGVDHAAVRAFKEARAAGQDVLAAGGTAGLNAEQARGLDVVLRGFKLDVQASLDELGITVEKASAMADLVEPATLHAGQIKALDARIMAAEKVGKLDLRASLREQRGNLLTRQAKERARIVKALRGQFAELNDPKWAETLDFFQLSGKWQSRGRVASSAVGRVLSGRKVPNQSTVVDGTFSAPKSVSVLLGMVDESLREEIMAIHSQAVQTAIDALYEQLARTRTGRGGSVEHEVEALRAAEIIQVDARDGGVHLHSHFLIDLAALAEDRVGALNQQALFDAAKSIGMVYQQQLRYEMSERFEGVRWGRVDNGLSEIRNIPDSVLRAFSERNTDILLASAEAKRLQQDDAKAWDVLTRVAKDYTYFEGLRIRSERAADGADLGAQEVQDLADYREFQRLIEHLEESMSQHESQRLAKTTRPDKDADKAHEQAVYDKFEDTLTGVFGDQAQTVRGRVLAGLIEAGRAEKARSAGRERLPERVREAVDAVAMEHGSFNENMVFQWLVENTPGGWFSGQELIDAIDAQFAEINRSEDLILIKESGRSWGWLAANRKAKGNQYTTRSVLSLEYTVDDWANRMADKQPRAITAGQYRAIQEELDATPLNVEQRAFAEAVCGATKGLVVVEAPAGTGKSYALGACRRSLSRQERFVVGLAPTNVAAAQLREAADVAMSVDMFLTLHTYGADVSRFQSASAREWEAEMLQRHRADLEGLVDPVQREALARAHSAEWATAQAEVEGRRRAEIAAFWKDVRGAVGDLAKDGVSIEGLQATREAMTRQLSDVTDPAVAAEIRSRINKLDGQISRAPQAAAREAAEAVSKARQERGQAVQDALRTGDWSGVGRVETRIDDSGTVAVRIGDQTFKGVVSAEKAAALQSTRERYGIGLADGERREVAMTVVVDEAGMLGTERFAQLAGACDALDVEQVVLMGDSRQLSAVRSFSGIFTRVSQRTSQDRNGVQFQLREVARAKATWEKDAQIVMHDAAGKLTEERAAELAQEYAEHGRLIDVDSNGRALAEALDWYQNARSGVGQERKSALLISTTNEGADRLNALYLQSCEENSRRVDELKAAEDQGVLTTEQSEELAQRLTNGLDWVDTAGPVFRAAGEWGQLKLRRGERVSFRTNDLSKGISNKDTGVVEGVNEQAETVSVRLDATGRIVVLDGQSKVWGASRESRARHAYASTVHSAQGVTVDEALLVATGGRAISAELAYVALSRGREFNGAVVVGNEEWDAKDFLTGSMLNRETPEAVLDFIERTAREELAADVDDTERLLDDFAAQDAHEERLKGHVTDWDGHRGTPGGKENQARFDAEERRRQSERGRTIGLGHDLSRSM